MALHENEMWRCPNAQCGCEVRVTRGAGPAGGDEPLRCCCGEAMEKRR